MESKQNEFWKNLVKKLKKALRMAKKCKKTLVFIGIIWYNKSVIGTEFQ